MNIQYNLIHDLCLKKLVNNCMNTLTINKMILHITNKHIIKNKKNAIPSQLSLAVITGQKTKSVYSKNAIAVFQLRKNQFFGWKVSLRKLAMKRFMQKLLLVALPQKKGFLALNNSSLDNYGNCHLGYKQLLVFPELEFHFNVLNNISGINVTIVSNSKNKEDMYLLLTGNKLPIKSK